MTNRQYQGFIRALLALCNKELKINPDSDFAKEIANVLQSMLEDGTD